MSIEAFKNEDSTNKELNDFSKEIKELANSVPEMNENEIKQLNESQLYDIFLQSEGKSYHDQNGEYIIINLKNQKRKLYYTLGQPLKDGHTYIGIDTIENFNISIGRKVGDKIIGVYAEIDNETKNIYKGNLSYKNGKFQPKK